MPDLLEYVEEPGEPGHVEPERVPVGVVVLPQLRLTLYNIGKYVLKGQCHEIFCHFLFHE